MFAMHYFAEFGKPVLNRFHTSIFGFNGAKLNNKSDADK